MATSPLERVLSSLSDPDQSLSFYRDSTGMKIRCEEDPSREEAWLLLKAPAGVMVELFEKQAGGVKHG